MRGDVYTCMCRKHYNYTWLLVSLLVDGTPASSSNDSPTTMMTIPSTRVFSRGLLAPRCNPPRVCLAASYLIRRLSTALLGAGHYRVAVCTCSSWPTASEPLEITVLFKISRVPVSLYPPPPASFSFLPSIQRRSGTFRSLALLLRWYLGFEGNLRPCEGKMDEGLSRNVVTSVGGIKASKKASISYPSPSASDPNYPSLGLVVKLLETNVPRMKREEVMEGSYVSIFILLWSKIFLLF